VLAIEKWAACRTQADETTADDVMEANRRRYAE
jgi:hypothetical protein